LPAISLGHDLKNIAPRVPTRATPAGERASARLPDDIVAEQNQRFVVFTGVGAAVWTIALTIDMVVMPLGLGVRAPAAVFSIEIFAAAASAILFLFLKYSTRPLPVTAAAGLWFMLLNAAAIALLNTWVFSPKERLGGLSWVVFVILVSSMIVPSTPRRILAASLVAASLEPLGVWIAHLRGSPAPSPVETLVLCLPNYVAAVVATLPAHVFQRLGRRVREARELGSYQLIELLGRGGMGEVWRARHRWLARHAAIKLVRPEVLGAGIGPDAQLVLRRFEREAQATATLTSPHSIRLFDFGVTDDGTFYYVMELLFGCDLESLVRNFGPLPAERAVYLLKQVCLSLAEAHARGLVHRDVKPANMFICRMGLEYDFVKVLDFGLVLLGEPDRQQPLMTSEETRRGTPAYMAPEIILGRSSVDGRADVYSLGCTAYFLLTGRRVFEGGTSIEALIDHVHTAPRPLSQLTPSPISPELERVVLRCLDKDPNRRPQDALDLFELLDDCGGLAEWSGASAQRWWETHLPDLAGPLPLVDAVTPSTTSHDIAESATADVTMAAPTVEIPVTSRADRLRSVFSRRA
jgi:serine/threonine-protein kinase